MRRAAASLLLLALVATGCTDQQEKYCDAVADRQQELGAVLGEGGATALLEALPIFRELAGEAPDDIRDEWRTVIDALVGLDEALDDAGVDAATYDRDDPPPGLTLEQKDRIDAAARELTNQQTVTAFEGVQQQARDVCGTQLQV
jgi:hypothetical protein